MRLWGRVRWQRPSRPSSCRPGVLWGVRWEVGGEWLAAEVFGEVAGDMLEDAWCLGFAEEAGGEVVEGVLPADHHIGGEGVVEGDLVEAGCHVSFGQVNVGGKEGKEVVV